MTQCPPLNPILPTGIFCHSNGSIAKRDLLHIILNIAYSPSLLILFTRELQVSVSFSTSKLLFVEMGSLNNLLQNEYKRSERHACKQLILEKVSATAANSNLNSKKSVVLRNLTGMKLFESI